MRIADLDPTDGDLLERLARLSFEAGKAHAPNWLPTLDAAREEVADATAEGHITRVAFGDGPDPLAWGSCFHVYGHVWELHPLLVAVARQRKGYGRALAEDLERQAALRGAGVLIVGTSDEVGATSLYGRDLYDDPLGALMNMRVRPSHAVRFWQRIGYQIVGVTPDAEGPGMPSIHLAKRPRSLP